AKFFWGHELDVFKAPVGFKHSEWFKECGPVCWKLLNNILIIGYGFCLAQIRNIVEYSKKAPPARPIIKRLVGEGIVWAEGDQHRRFRRLMDTVFSASSTKQMTPDVLNVSARLVTRLSQHLQDNGGDAVLNMVTWTASATLDIIGFVGFGYDFQLGESDEAKQIIGAWANQVAAGLSDTAFFAEMVLRAFPFLLSLPLEALETQSKIRKICDKLARKLIDNAKWDEASSGIKGSVRASGEGRMTTQETIDNVRGGSYMAPFLVMAGYETTAGTLDFILYELARSPERQQKLRDELLSYIGEPTYDDLMSPDRLPYLDAVIKEGIRMYPAAVHNARITSEDDVLPLETPIRTPSGEVIQELHLPAGQIVYTPHMSIQRLEGVWRDGETFMPERWLEPGGLAPKEKLPIGWSNLLSFNAGPRQCLGYRLGEWLSILFSLISNFVFHDASAEVKKRVAVVLVPTVAGEEDKGAQMPLRVTFAH
ncbi:cytochrome P450, partial [Heliocybe sulcata]